MVSVHNGMDVLTALFLHLSIGFAVKSHLLLITYPGWRSSHIQPEEEEYVSESAGVNVQGCEGSGGPTWARPWALKTGTVCGRLGAVCKTGGGGAVRRQKHLGLYL